MSLKQQWIDALLSGKYKQGKRYLRDGDNNYCCLGVLGKVCGGTWRRTDWNKHSTYYPGNGTNYEAIWNGPDDVLAEPLSGLSVANKLALMNDAGRSFRDIADWIDLYLNDDLSLKEEFRYHVAED